ncbi:Hypothetical_protein [Hexamita inflata]|uniref:Hypothetical_protein n=1 Tax=Hexamita inflata TaxID=28002 RepID=A0AA86Q5K8_9EUKA|nr:Hypothetical protein HINF_LOCUS37407 [Hexamita inflata]
MYYSWQSTRIISKFTKQTLGTRPTRIRDWKSLCNNIPKKQKFGMQSRQLSRLVLSFIFMCLTVNRLLCHVELGGRQVICREVKRFFHWIHKVQSRSELLYQWLRQIQKMNIIDVQCMQQIGQNVI